MRPVWIYSIPGSATRFIMWYLRNVLDYARGGPAPIDRNETKKLIQHHVSLLGEQEPQFKAIAAKGIKTIVPIRPPVATAISREHNWNHETVDKVKQMWAALRATIGKLDALVIPIDAPWFNHARLLQLIEKHLDARPDREGRRDFLDSWPKVGATKPRPARTAYDETGVAVIGGRSSRELDQETVWYIEALAEFAAGPYRRL